MDLTHKTPTSYRAYVDGLRAVAVLAVLFFHAGIGISGGYVGVDVFFVISGFLITGLILKDLDSGQFQILAFWERRVRRILPALVVVVLASLVAGWFLLFPIDLKNFGESVLAQATLVSNVYFWRKSGYFAQAAEVQPLLHTWSLAVEEQFYLLFPFLLVAIKRYSRESLVPVILLLGGASFSLCVFCSYRHPSANFYFLPTRAWELLIGAFLAAIPAERTAIRWLNEALSWTGLLAILGSVFFYGRETRFPGVAAILPCVGAGLVIWANGHTLTSAGKLLAARPIVFVGLISYSLYLWHWPVLVFSQYYAALGPISQGQRTVLLIASAILAALSWRFVETPFRQQRIPRNRSQIFIFAGGATAALVLAGLAIHRTKGMPSRIPAAALQYYDAAGDLAFRKELNLDRVLAGDFVELGAGDKHPPIRLLVWGDSHAMSAMSVFDFLCKEHSVRGIAATHSATAPLVGYNSDTAYALKGESVAYNNAVVEFVRAKRVTDVVLVAAWGSYVTLDGETARLRRGLRDTLDTLKDTGTRIWIMRQVPEYPWSVPRGLASAVLHGQNPEALGLPLAEYRRQLLRTDPIFEGLAKDHPNVVVLDPTAVFLSRENLCRVTDRGRALYFDNHHLSVAGAMLLRPLVEPIFGGMLKVDDPARGRGAAP